MPLVEGTSTGSVSLYCALSIAEGHLDRLGILFKGTELVEVTILGFISTTLDGRSTGSVP